MLFAPLMLNQTIERTVHMHVPNDLQQS